jgi:hypothetical protein
VFYKRFYSHAQRLFEMEGSASSRSEGKEGGLASVNLYMARFARCGALIFQSLDASGDASIPDRPLHSKSAERTANGDTSTHESDDTASEQFSADDTVPASVRERNRGRWDSDIEDGPDDGTHDSDSDPESEAVPLTTSTTLDGEFIIDRIIDGPNARGKYLVKWKDHSAKHDSREPEDHLSPGDVEEYEAKRVEDEEAPLVALLQWEAS